MTQDYTAMGYVADIDSAKDDDEALWTLLSARMLPRWRELYDHTMRTRPDCVTPERIEPLCQWFNVCFGYVRDVLPADRRQHVLWGNQDAWSVAACGVHIFDSTLLQDAGVDFGEIMLEWREMSAWRCESWWRDWAEVHMPHKKDVLKKLIRTWRANTLGAQNDAELKAHKESWSSARNSIHLEAIRTWSEMFPEPAPDSREERLKQSHRQQKEHNERMRSPRNEADHDLRRLGAATESLDCVGLLCSSKFNDLIEPTIRSMVRFEELTLSPDRRSEEDIHADYMCRLIEASLNAMTRESP